MFSFRAPVERAPPLNAKFDTYRSEIAIYAHRDRKFEYHENLRRIKHAIPDLLIKLLDLEIFMPPAIANMLDLASHQQISAHSEEAHIRTLHVQPLMEHQDLADHRWLNMAAVDAAFPDFVISPRSGLIKKDKKLLRASEVCHYYFLDPHFYRPIGCVMGVSSAVLLSKLRQFPSNTLSVVFQS